MSKSKLQPVIISNDAFMKYYVAKLPYGLEMRTKQLLINIMRKLVSNASGLRNSRGCL
ncbi:MAG: hypothetical protein WBE34_20685 [Candidatus Nitrosopolaris sp.]